MANIQPFSGFRYNKKLIGDLGTVLAPPWDVINQNQQADLVQCSPYNIIHLIARNADPKKVKTILRKWRSDSILVSDKEAGFYYLKHTFTYQGDQLTRQGIFGLLELEDFSSGNIIPHENIFPEQRDNRYRLIEECRANFSPVFLLYQDPDRIMEKIKLDLAESSETKFNGDHLQFLRITGKNIIQEITGFFGDRKLFIADGHHRYQAALKFYQNNPSPENKYVLVYLAGLGSPELIICPTHRYLLTAESLEERRPDLEKFFEVQKVDSQAEMFKRMRQTKDNLSRFGICDCKNFFVLILKNRNYIQDYLPAGHSEIYRFLDVVILHEVILKQILGWREAGTGKEIEYERDAEKLLEKQRKNKKGLIFFLNPVPQEQLLAIINNHEVMPHKSTYFFPKVPSGLVLHLF